jgi:NAD(P)-dependent dehydrogenase (short-subunit alcohol dehydrogenase family)
MSLQQTTESFADRVVIVAGGTGALGSAVAQAFLDHGATVVVTQHATRDPNVAQRFKVADAARLRVATLDVTDAAAVQSLLAEVVARHARLDALVITVGAWAGGQPLWAAPADELERMLHVNLHAAHRLARAAAPLMRAAGRGAIVNVAAKTGLDPTAGNAAYAAAKAGALALMASLAADLAGSGVRVNSVLPKVIDTAANRQAMPNAPTAASWTTPESIARVILFLCSDDAAAIHGAAIPVYGAG